MHQSNFGNWKLGLLVLSSVFGFTRAEIQFNRPPFDIKVNFTPTVWGASEIVIVPSKLYSINCNASGLPKPSIKWKYNDEPLNNSTYVINYNNGTVFFPNFNDLQNGYYQCEAINPLGTSLSTKYHFVRKTNVEESKEKDKTNVEGVEGKPYSLKCKDTEATFPRLFKKWVTTEDGKPVTLDNRRGIDLEGNMWFAYLELKDTNAYTCAFGQTAAHSGEALFFLNEVALNVISAVNKEGKPSLEFRTGKGQDVKAFLGRELTLECFFSGYPAPYITWKDTSKNEITGSNTRFKLEDFNRRLTILSVKEEDEGKFLCTADNGHGSEPGEINVNITSAPIKVPNQGLTNLVKPKGIEVILKCQAKALLGESLDKPVWYRNGKLLRNESLPDPRRYTFSNGDTQLTIKNITMNGDTACFQCNVTNSEGFAFYDASLLVIEPIIITKQPSQVMEVAEDGAIDISVSATGDACCSITTVWEFNGQPLTNDEANKPPLMHDSTTGIRMFNTTGVPEPLVKSRLGQYRVILDNNYQRVVVEFSVTRKGAEAVEAAGAGFELWWLAIILGVLAIIIAIVIIVCCVKRNYPRQTYQLEKTELKHNLNPEEELLDQSFQEI